MPFSFHSPVGLPSFSTSHLLSLEALPQAFLGRAFLTGEALKVSTAQLPFFKGGLAKRGERGNLGRGVTALHFWLLNEPPLASALLSTVPGYLHASLGPAGPVGSLLVPLTLQIQDYAFLDFFTFFFPPQLYSEIILTLLCFCLCCSLFSLSLSRGFRPLLPFLSFRKEVIYQHGHLCLAWCLPEG